MALQSYLSPAATSTRPLPTQRYVYGIIRSDDPVLFEVNGVDADHEVYTVGEGGLAVVISDVVHTGFHSLDRTSAVRLLGAHQRVLETVQQDYPVLPVKFGTVLADDGQLRALLRRGAPLLGAALYAYTGREQYEVVVLWDVARVFQEIAVEERIVDLKAQLAKLPPEELGAGKLLLGQIVHGELQARRAALSAVVLEALRDLAEDMAPNPVMDDSMVCNTALLIACARRDDLDARLQQLDQQIGGALQIRCVGPLPPYSFATLEVQQPDPEAVAGALERLGLPEHTSLAAIKSAYRRLAAQAHPDHNPGAAGAAVEMEALTGDYKLLVAAAQAQAPAVAADDWPCHFDHDSVAGSFALAIRRYEVAPGRDEG